jgi:hypothetical protein
VYRNRNCARSPRHRRSVRNAELLVSDHTGLYQEVAGKAGKGDKDSVARDVDNAVEVVLVGQPAQLPPYARQHSQKSLCHTHTHTPHAHTTRTRTHHTHTHTPHTHTPTHTTHTPEREARTRLVGERNIRVLGKVVVLGVGAVAKHGTDEEVEHDRRELTDDTPEVEPRLPAQVACVCAPRHMSTTVSTYAPGRASVGGG